MIEMTQLKYSRARFANEIVAFPQQGAKNGFMRLRTNHPMNKTSAGCLWLRESLPSTIPYHRKCKFQEQL